MKTTLQTLALAALCAGAALTISSCNDSSSSSSSKSNTIQYFDSLEGVTLTSTASDAGTSEILLTSIRFNATDEVRDVEVVAKNDDGTSAAGSILEGNAAYTYEPTSGYLTISGLVYELSSTGTRYYVSDIKVTLTKTSDDTAELISSGEPVSLTVQSTGDVVPGYENMQVVSQTVTYTSSL